MSSTHTNTATRHLTAKELAERLGISVFDIYRMVREGTLPVLRIGERRMRFRLVDIEAWEEERVQQSKPGGS